MTESEFWGAIEEVYGSALGRSLASELYLLECRGTAVEAMAAGVPLEQIWEELVRETGQTVEARWVHRRSLNKGGAGKSATQEWDTADNFR